MNTNKGYEPLAAVLQDALDQAQSGKGQSRHAGDGEPFMDQQIMEISRRQGNVSGTGFQAHKKLYEAEGMLARGEYDAARREILGAINYAAACVLRIDEIVGAGLDDVVVIDDGRAHAFKNPMEDKK